MKILITFLLFMLWAVEVSAVIIPMPIPIYHSGGGGGDQGEVVVVAQNLAEEGLLTRLERRNPLAFAHYANHPPVGTPPNVMVAAVDWKSSVATTAENEIEQGRRDANADDVSGELRAYIPVVDFCIPSKSSNSGSNGNGAAENSTITRSSSTNNNKIEKENIQNFLPRKNDTAPCVVLVALRDIENEELFLNYRLNPNAPGGLPDWYSSVDIEEDQRRWA